MRKDVGRLQSQHSADCRFAKGSAKHESTRRWCECPKLYGAEPDEDLARTKTRDSMRAGNVMLAATC